MDRYKPGLPNRRWRDLCGSLSFRVRFLSFWKYFGVERFIFLFIYLFNDEERQAGA